MNVANFQNNHPITHITMTWLLCAVFLTSLPHLLNLSIIISSIFVVLFIVAILIHLKKIKTPHKFTRYVLTILIVALVLFNYGTLIGQEAGVALLVTMSAIKLLEMFSLRDVYISVLINFFILVTHFLYSFSFGILIYAFCCAIILLSTLLELSKHSMTNRLDVVENTKYSLGVFLQSVPIMLVLFFFFPRIDSPLWGMQSHQQSGTTGLSDNMQIGTINSLSQSSAVAFRVEFKDKIPDNNQLYWRGPVLTYTDGRNWNVSSSENNQQRFITRIPFSSTQQTVSYTVTMEPNEHSWYFALDLPINIPKDSRLTEGYQIVSNKPINQPVRYQVTSATEYQLKPLHKNELTEALQLPMNINQRTVSLGKRLMNSYDSKIQIINAALDYFVEKDFSYTLYPPLLSSNDPIDQFIFSTRRGFCEHFSAAFTTLMRAAGIPARVVTGYQGGELNPLGDHLTVRQLDAHAWSEVWLDQIGWVRIDPTSVIAPNRINAGANETFAQTASSRSFLFNSPLMRNVIHSIDWIDNQWTQWVVNYDQNKQSNFMQNLGLNGWFQIIMTMTLILSLFSAFIAFYVIYRHRLHYPVQVTLWNRFCEKLAKVGLARQPHEGPRDYYHRIVTLQPSLKATVKPIINDYIKLNYSGQSDKNLEVSLKQAIAKFDPKKNL